jgi:hypothetical protein
VTIATVSQKNWVQESSYNGCGHLFFLAPLVVLKKMDERGETPP